MNGQIAKIRLLVVDDHPLTRAGIRSMLEKAPDIEIVGEAEDGSQALALAAELYPDVLLLDLVVPGPKPVEIETWVREHCPQTATLILTGHARDAYLAHSIQCGAAGFLTKDEAPERLIEAIRRAYLGQAMFSQDQLLIAARWRAVAGDRWDALSEREQEVLAWMVQGMDNQGIAKLMDISLNTVRCHNQHIFEKLGVAHCGEAVAFVLKHGLLDL